MNSSKEYAFCIVEALERAGCPHTADITRRALSSLGIQGPVTASAIDAVIYQDDPAREQVLSECDALFYRYEEPIEERLFEYIRAHREQIRLPT